MFTKLKIIVFKPAHPALCFSFFLVWLWLIPMEGFLTKNIHSNHISLIFMLFHSAGLLTLSFLNIKNILAKFTDYAVVLTSLLTVLLPYTQNYLVSTLLIAITGCTSSLIITHAIVYMKKTSSPLFTSTYAFIIAFLIQIFLGKINIPHQLTFFIISLLLLYQFKKPFIAPNYNKRNKHLRSYYVLLFIFYITGGILYAYILPYIATTPNITIVDNLSYIVGIVFGAYLFRIRSEVPVLAAIVFILLTFSFIQGDFVFLQTISIQSIHISFGLMEIFVILLIMKYIHRLKATVLILASMSMGVLSGQLITVIIGSELSLSVLIVMGNIIVITTVFILYFSKNFAFEFSDNTDMKNLQNGNKEIFSSNLNNISDKLNKAYYRLSDKEYQVLANILDKKTIKITAASLGVSESTVKTYLKRIYEKYDIKSRKELVDLFLND